MSMLQVENRLPRGEKSKQLRKRGVVPMALIERNHQTLMIQAPGKAMRDAMSHVDAHGRIEFQISGERRTRTAIVKNVEQDPIHREMIHVTLQEVADDDVVTVEVPLVAIGHSADTELEGTTLQMVTDHLKVHGRVADVPERIEVDISNLHLREHISAKDIELPKGIGLVTAPEAVICSITRPRAFTEPEPETTEETPEDVPLAA